MQRSPLPQQIKMTGWQWLIIAFDILLNFIDGFDLLVIAFTAPAISQAFGLTGETLGMVFSAGLLGMGLGSFLLAPIADFWGRKCIILLALGLTIIGMLASATATAWMSLSLYRFITGLGIGTILASSNVMTSEYATPRWRNLAISLHSTGVALGAVAGGILTHLLLVHYHWHSLFIIGALFSSILFIAIATLMPESREFIVSQQPRNALAKYNRIQQRLRQPQRQSLPEKSVTTHLPLMPLTTLLSPTHRATTLALWIGLFCSMFTFSCITSWTPKLLASTSSAERGIHIGIIMNCGGIFGAIILGVFASRYALKNVIRWVSILAACFCLAFALSLTHFSLALCFAFGLGLMSNSAMAGFYTLAPQLYPTAIRTSGVGAAISIGRIGSVISPLLAGVLIDHHWTPQHLFLLTTVIFLLPLIFLRHLSHR